MRLETGGARPSSQWPLNPAQCPEHHLRVLSMLRWKKWKAPSLPLIPFEIWLSKGNLFLYSQYFWHQMCKLFTWNNSLILFGIQLGALQLNSFWHNPELVRLHRLRAQAQKTVRRFRIQLLMGPRLLTFLSDLANRSGVPMTPSSGTIICCNISQNPGKHFTYYYHFILKDIIKDTNKKPHEEVLGWSLEGSLSIEVSVSVEFG